MNHFKAYVVLKSVPRLFNTVRITLIVQLHRIQHLDLDGMSKIGFRHENIHSSDYFRDNDHEHKQGELEGNKLLD